jgi:hypothetical protein
MISVETENSAGDHDAKDENKYVNPRAHIYPLHHAPTVDSTFQNQKFQVKL